MIGGILATWIVIRLRQPLSHDDENDNEDGRRILRTK